jgi:hypothetical protein
MGSGVTGVAHVIQLSVAPVFLITGIGAMLSVMTNRLARIVDRSRALELQVEGGIGVPEHALTELRSLERRAHLISRSIAFCTSTALLVCAVIAILFAGAFFGFDTSAAVALLFIASMLAFFIGLLMFLREIFLAMATRRIGVDQAQATKHA